MAERQGRDKELPGASGVVRGGSITQGFRDLGGLGVWGLGFRD